MQKPLRRNVNNRIIVKGRTRAYLTAAPRFFFFYQNFYFFFIHRKVIEKKKLEKGLKEAIRCVNLNGRVRTSLLLLYFFLPFP